MALSAAAAPPYRALQARLRSGAGRWPVVGVATRTLALIGLLMLLDRWVMAVTDLPPGGYEQALLLTQLPAQMFASPARAAVTLLLLGGMLLARRSLWRAWSAIEYGSALRPLVLLMALMLAWWFASYPSNHYFGQPHHVERIALILLALLIAWRPLFILPFVLVLCTVVWQFFQPIGDYSWAQPSMPLRLLLLFFAALWLHAFSGREHSIDWLFVGLCLIAAHYWIPGLAKLRIDWPGYGHIYHFLLNTYANGWLGFLEPPQVAAAARVVALFDWPMRIATLVGQLGVVFLLWRRFTLLGFLLLWALFHLGIFALSGILFWQWILLEAGFALLIHRLWRGRPIPFLSRPHFVVSVLLIAGSPLWVRPVVLAWLDSPVSYTYRFGAITADGERYSLPPGYFAPYDFAFTLGFFKYLSPGPSLAITWGAASERELVDTLMHDRSANGVARVEREFGREQHDAVRSAALHEFIRRFVRNRSAGAGATPWFERLPAPTQITTWPHGRPYSGEAPIRSVTINRVTTLFDGERYREVADLSLGAVVIEPEPAIRPPLDRVPRVPARGTSR